MNINYCELCGGDAAREKREILTLENSDGKQEVHVLCKACADALKRQLIRNSKWTTKS
jgi:hypothetical protein